MGGKFFNLFMHTTNFNIGILWCGSHKESIDVIRSVEIRCHRNDDSTHYKRYCSYLSSLLFLFLITVFPAPQISISLLMLAIRPMLVVHHGKYNFGHQYLKNAVTHRYLLLN